LHPAGAALGATEHRGLLSYVAAHLMFLYFLQSRVTWSFDPHPNPLPSPGRGDNSHFTLPGLARDLVSSGPKGVCRPLGHGYGHCRDAAEVALVEGEDLAPGFGRLLGPVGGAVDGEEAVAGTVVAQEFIGLAVLLEDFFRPVDLLRAGIAVVVTEDA